jgi:undecaprenyl-phosphate galactose phosphotransferase
MYHRRDPLWIEAGKVLKSLALAFIATFSIISLGQMSAEVSRLFMCLQFFLATFTFIILRILAKHILFKQPYFQMRALIVGDESRLPAVAKAFENERYMGLKIVRHIAINSVPEDIDAVLHACQVDAAIMVPTANMNSDITALFSHIHTKVSHMFYIPMRSAMDLTNAETGQLLRSQQGYLLVKNALQSPLNRFLKRLFDIVCVILLSPFVLPVIAVLAVLIRLGSPGAGIFSHERMGSGGKAFRVYKLRTMYKDADIRLKALIESDSAIREEWEANYKLKDDPRITKIGKFLRKTSLDELPQFFNVLKGEMSFVGPRPVLKVELEKYYKEQTVYYNMAMPGITGLWQVSGRNDTTYDDRVEMDSWYVFNWSLWLDIVILFSTPLVVIVRRGAY